MLALRSALFLIFQAVTVIPWALICLLLAPFPLRVRYRFTIGWPRMVLWAARVLCGIRWEVRGWDNLPKGAAVLLSKHQSTWETFFYVAYMPTLLCFVFKRELLWVPFFGWGIGLLEMIHIDRSKGRNAFESVVEQGQRKSTPGDGSFSFRRAPEPLRGLRVNTSPGAPDWPFAPVLQWSRSRSMPGNTGPRRPGSNVLAW